MRMAKPGIISLSCLLLLISCFHPVVSNNVSEQNEVNVFEILLDCQQRNGFINAFSEMNCGPLPNTDVINAVDIGDRYREIGVELIRTHDFNGPCDISMIFPNEHADPCDASSYNFTVTDRYITSIINVGANVFFRLGESASAHESLRQPPENMSQWAEVCKHIVMHYNDGWADGFFYDIEYWEIWNEPDLSGFWNGTAEQYYSVYHETVTTLKSYDSALKIGGPCTSSLENENYTIGFLSYVKENLLPLDFFSWHRYTDTPSRLFEDSQYVRMLLDSHGFFEAENINTEWNYDILSPQRDKDNAKNAAFTACCLSCFHDAALDHAIRYRGTQDNNWLMRFIGFDLSLFSYDGIFKTPALAYLAFHLMETETPERLETPVIDAQDGLTYLAGISDDKSNISILISNYEAEDAEYTVTMQHIPWNSSYRIIQYLIDDDHHFQIVEQTMDNGSGISFTKEIQSFTVHFIRLTDTQTIPDEGPETLEIPLLLRLKLFDVLGEIIGVLLLLLTFT